MNTNFGKVTEDHKLVYAPDTLGRMLGIPAPWVYHNAGYWEIDHTVPVAPDGKISRPTGLWDLVVVQEEHVPELNENGEPVDPEDAYRPLLKICRQRYEFVDVPVVAPPDPVPRRFSRKAFYLALARENLYTDFVAWAESAEVLNGLNVKDLLLVSTYLQEGDPEFEAFRAVAAEKFGEYTLNAMLDASEDEEW